MVVVAAAVSWWGGWTHLLASRKTTAACSAVISLRIIERVTSCASPARAPGAPMSWSSSSPGARSTAEVSSWRRVVAAGAGQRCAPLGRDRAGRARRAARPLAARLVSSACRYQHACVLLGPMSDSDRPTQGVRRLPRDTSAHAECCDHSLVLPAWCGGGDLSSSARSAGGSGAATLQTVNLRFLRVLVTQANGE